MFPYSLTQSSLFLMEHRSSTSARHLTLEQCPSLSATGAVPLPNLPFLSASRCAGVCLSCASPACGFHSIAFLAMHPSGLLSAWPIQPPARCLISFSEPVAALFVSRAPHCAFVHQIRRMFLIDERLQLLLQSLLGSPSTGKGRVWGVSERDLWLDNVS